MKQFIQLSNEDIDTALSHDLREEVRRCNKHIAAMQTRIDKLEAGIRRIINGEYDNARTIDAAEKFARELLRDDK